MGRSPTPPVPVLFIMGKGRSGSTLLDNVLGQVPGVFSTGELVHLWDWGLRRRVRCGCGADVLDCEVWGPALASSVDIRSRARDADRIEAIWHDYHAVARWARFPQLVRRRGPDGWPALDRYATVARALYAALRDVTGADVLVDSSKTPLNPAALGLVDGIAGSAVHLVRDPRAVGFSWQRTKAWSDRDDGGTMPRYGALHTTASWTLRNLTAEVVLRRWPPERTARVRYEDLCADPRATLGRLLDLVGLGDRPLPLGDDRTVMLEPTHTVGGNPGRMTRGEIEIRPDRDWEDGIDPWSRRVLTFATTPLRRRYGYGRSAAAPGASGSASSADTGDTGGASGSGTSNGPSE